MSSLFYKLCTLLRILSLGFLLTTFDAKADFSDISKIYFEVPTTEKLSICSGGGCAIVNQVSITHDEWSEVLNLFAKSKDSNLSEAAFERKKIAEAIGLLETILGVKTGAYADRAGTFNNSDYTGQMDCNDEAINTTTYIHLMLHYGLITLHESEDIRTRKFFFSGWPHSTAVIHEKASKEQFAVDSWFYDNGIPAVIIPLKLWKSGYIPADSPIVRH